MTRVTRPGDKPLPRNVMTLPADIPETMWKAWPRKADVAAVWRIRPRQVDAWAGHKKIRVFFCPDGTTRVPTEDLVIMVGQPPGEAVPGEVPASPAPEPVDLEDPVASMFKEAVNMLRSADQRTLEVLKLLLDPMNAATAAMREVLAEGKANNAALLARISQLELARDETLKAREEAIDNRHLRDLVMQQELSKEQRRSRIVDSFMQQLPIFMAKWTGGTLSDFIGNYTPDEWELLFSTGFIKDEQKATIRNLIAQAAAAKKAAEARAAAQAVKEAAKAAAANGAAAASAAPPPDPAKTTSPPTPPAGEN